MLVGMLPSKLLYASKSMVREERFPNEEGMAPERSFDVKMSFFKGESDSRY